MGTRPDSWALSAWPPVPEPGPGSAGSELTGPPQTSTTHVCMGPCELCISKTFPTCLLRVTHSLWGDFQGEKKRASILTCPLLKMKDGGGLPSPWQCSATASPSLTRPWGDSFHSSTMVVGSKHTQTHTQTHTIKLSLLLKSLSKATATALTAQTVFGSVCHKNSF